MDQLFLAVSKNVTYCLKGRWFSRYGPIRIERAELLTVLKRFFSKATTELSLPLVAALIVNATNQLFPLSSHLRHIIRRTGSKMAIDVGRMLLPQRMALFRILGFNAREIPLLPEGVY